MIQSENVVFEGTVIITDNQTAGRGQRGNSWEASSGQNLTFSLILKPIFLKASDQFQLNVAVSMGVFDFLSEFIDKNLTVKWSNDIYVGDKKMGGILIENSLQGYKIGHSIVGIGLNINQTEFINERATSLRKITENPLKYDLSELLKKLLENIEINYLKIKNNEYELLKIKYLHNLFRFNEYHYFKRNGQIFLGQIVGIDENGKLGIETDGNLIHFDFKEVEFVI